VVFLEKFTCKRKKEHKEEQKESNDKAVKPEPQAILRFVEDNFSLLCG
jgi:hypothetical protein